jgi:protein-L-isoaspartate(D-aspartate) O-methyltransferase
MAVVVATVRRVFHVALSSSRYHDTAEQSIASLVIFRMDPTENARARMVDEQLSSRNIQDLRVLETMRKVPRHAFVPESVEAEAYRDTPLPIGQGQTISQPYIVALMAETLRVAPETRVLEIGTGCGYSAAVLAALGQHVVTVERHALLAQRATAVLARLGVQNVQVHVADGTLGWPDAAPYDAIAVTAAGPIIPPALLDQLALGGRLVIPVGTEPEKQNLVLVERTGPDGFAQTNICPVRFVPLVGAQGWGNDPGLSR